MENPQSESEVDRVSPNGSSVQTRETKIDYESDEFRQYMLRGAQTKDTFYNLIIHGRQDGENIMWFGMVGYTYLITPEERLDPCDPTPFGENSFVRGKDILVVPSTAGQLAARVALEGARSVVGV